MQQDLKTIRFTNGHVFAGNTGVVDATNAVIHGVSLITGELEAEGHKLFVDSTTVKQLHALAGKMGKVPVTLDHDGGISDVNGYIDNFRIDGDKLRGDWHLLQTHDETVTMLERAERQPETFGLSVAFKGPPKGVLVDGKARARAEILLSADVVKRTAANPEGLFGAREDQVTLRRLEDRLIALAAGRKFEDSVDTEKLAMPNQASAATNAEPTLAQVLEAVTGLGQRLDAIEQGQAEPQGELSQEEYRNLLDNLYNATDAELAAFNEQHGLQVSRAEIDSEVESYNASLGGEGEGEGEVAANATPEGGAAAGAGTEGTAATGATASAGATAFKALQSEVIALKSKISKTELAAKEEQETLLFSDIENKMTILAAQRDEAIELAERVVAENEALQLAVRTGTRPVRAGIDEGVRLFSANENGELHAFQKMIKDRVEKEKCSESAAILFCSGQNPGLHRDWLNSGGGKQVLHS